MIEEIHTSERQSNTSGCKRWVEDTVQILNSW